MIRKLSLADEAAAILALQRASYRVEAEIIGFDGIPPLRETLAELQACGETFYGWLAGAELAGAVACEVEADVLTISRMMVHPNHFRQGLAGRLLAYVEEVHPNVARLRVSTGALNTPAKNLYLRHGFVAVGDQEVAPGVFLTHFMKEK